MFAPNSKKHILNIKLKLKENGN